MCSALYINVFGAICHSLRLSAVKQRSKRVTQSILLSNIQTVASFSVATARPEAVRNLPESFPKELTGLSPDRRHLSI